jgi:hypothetical protein
MGDPASGLAVTSATDHLVVLIRSQPGMAQRLLAEHADDGHSRCRVCSEGAQAGRYSWPCAIALAADAALPGSETTAARHGGTEHERAAEDSGRSR